MNAEDWRPITTLPMPDQYPVMVFSKFQSIWRVNNMESLQQSPEITHWMPFVAPVNKVDAAFDEWWRDRFDSEILSKCNARHVWHAALAWKEGRT